MDDTRVIMRSAIKYPPNKQKKEIRIYTYVNEQNNS